MGCILFLLLNNNLLSLNHFSFIIVSDVTNKSDYIHHFNFPKDEKDSEELSNLLWHEIYLSVENKLNENKKSSITN